MSHYDYPEDEFDARDDDAVAPVGTHRAPVPAWRGWVSLLAVLIIVPLLAWGLVALLGHGAGGSSSTSAATSAATAGSSAAATDAAAASPDAAQSAAPAATTAAAEATPTAEATQAAAADLTKGITIHNGTSTQGLAARTSSKLTNAGFTSVTVSQGIYSPAEPTVTTVYYASADLKATAEAVGSALGVTNVVESAAEAQSNPIVVVLRSDYQE